MVVGAVEYNVESARGLVREGAERHALSHTQPHLEM